MKVVIQRASHAQIHVSQQLVGQIKQGLLVLAGFEPSDTQEDYLWMSRKIVNMRIFNDANDVMNASVLDIQGELLVASQFTLHASTKKGNRPSYQYASPPDLARTQYQTFLKTLQSYISTPLQTGIFGSDMKISLLNDGPVTIVMDSKHKN